MALHKSLGNIIITLYIMYFKTFKHRRPGQSIITTFWDWTPDPRGTSPPTSGLSMRQTFGWCGATIRASSTTGSGGGWRCSTGQRPGWCTGPRTGARGNTGALSQWTQSMLSLENILLISVTCTSKIRKKIFFWLTLNMLLILAHHQNFMNELLLVTLLCCDITSLSSPDNQNIQGAEWIWDYVYWRDESKNSSQGIHAPSLWGVHNRHKVRDGLDNWRKSLWWCIFLHSLRQGK